MPSSRVIRHCSLLLTLLFLFGLFAGSAGGAAPDVIRVDVAPRIDAVRPLQDLVNLKVAVDSPARGPVDLSFRLLAPQRGGFFTTDFPLVEDTTLIEMAVRLPDGRLDWSYAFPIRGTYRLEVKAVDAAGSSAEHTVLLEVREDWTKWGGLFGFLVFLFLLGFVAGRLFSGYGALSARLLVGVLGYLTLAGAGDAVADLKSKLVVAPPSVGSLSTIRWSVADEGLSRVEGALLTMNITQLEKDRTLFRLDRLSTQGNFKFEFQFTDASEHMIAATVVSESGDKVVETEERVQVMSPDPSLSDRLWPVFVFLLVVTAGLITGRLSRRRVTRNSFYGRRPAVKKGIPPDA